MYLMKKFLEEQNPDDSDSSSFDYKKCDKKKRREKTQKRNKHDKDIRNNPCLVPNFDDRLANYKQRYHQRITLGRGAGVFPTAICTNVFSKRRDKNANREVNNRIEKELKKRENSRHEKRNFEKDDLNRIITGNEGGISMEIDSTAPPPIDMEPFPNNLEAFGTIGADELTQNRDKLAKTTIRSDRTNSITYSETRNRTRKASTDIVENDFLQFKIYKKEEAQLILMYDELGKVLNKTMIIQKVTCFDDFPDMTQTLQDKLWKIRASRDENNFDPETSVSSVVKAYCYDYDERKLNSPGDEIQFKFVGRKNDGRMQDVKMRRKDHRRVASKERNKKNYSYFAKANEAKEMIFNTRPRSKGVDCVLPFDSCLVPTAKIGGNLSMNPIEYLENLSKDSGNEADRKATQLDEQMKRKLEGIRFSPSPVICCTDYETSPFDGDDVDEYLKLKTYRRRNDRLPRMTENEAFHFHEQEPELRCAKSQETRALDEFEICSKIDSTSDIALSQNRMPFDEMLKSFSQNIECLLAPPNISKTPEMKYYPYRLY